MAAMKEYTLTDELRETGVAYKRSQLSNDDAITYLARRGEPLVGYVTAEIQTPPPIVEQVQECHINELFVREDARRQGVASKLLTRIEDWARANDCESVKLRVDSENRAAIELYETGEYTIERHNMKKPLENRG
jgi:ribosomal protein S18 acetylase RimI-like enzyme